MTPQEAMDRADEIGAETSYRLQLAREAHARGREHGRESAVTDPDLGRSVGYDVGLGARQDARAFVHAVMEGFAAGSAERHDLAAKLQAEAGLMDGYAGKTDPATWRAHAAAGWTTWSAGQPGARQAGFLHKISAAAFAADNALPLFEWKGMTGHQLEIPEMEDGMNPDTWTREAERTSDADREPEAG